MEFHKADNGFIRKDDFHALIAACKTIGNAFWDSPMCGVTINGMDYVPCDMLEEPEDILNAINIIQSYLNPKKEQGS